MTSQAATQHRARSRPPLRWILLAIFLLATIGAGAAFFWHNRAIQAVVLTPPEKVELAKKLEAVEESRQEPRYERGQKTITLTERELNGLLNENTALGDQLKIELANNAVHARLSADIPQDSPFLAGQKLKGRARFYIEDKAGRPTLMLDDVTIWGISLPNAWLGNIKGQDLLGSILPTNLSTGGGLKSFQVKNNSLVIELAE